MRIALFSGNYNYLREGANQALNRLVEHLEAKRGYRVRVYSPVSDTPAFKPKGTLVPVPSIALPVRNEFRLALGLPKPVRNDIRAFAPDLIHVSTPDILGTRAQSLAKRMKVPILASMHTRFETYLAYYGLNLLTPVAQAHLRRFYRRSDYVLCPTPSLAADMNKVR
ncbi:MAG: glycosyltransferase, partial [Allosphingosinicella sp.]